MHPRTKSILQTAFFVCFFGIFVAVAFYPMSKRPKKDSEGYYFERPNGEKKYSTEAEDTYHYLSKVDFAANMLIAGTLCIGAILTYSAIRGFIRVKSRNKN